ncbi:MAG TPA: DUF2726 domain-containing protein [Candidatus Paceibacterota bacterium]|nr:DUF2726 domain-containing protein [Candidatus Pacearchaeota archaeon]HRZ51328.1 DUF2726 domain-containing protein [Candidatus Paceibacterota bacterium]HSA37050.1 DUF2726 domain-containing protein [Candidatus Paceibacterota bacterium]
MDNLLIFGGLLVLAVLAFKFFQKPQDDEGGDFVKKGYQYKKKDFFLTRAEHQCYDALIEAAGKDYYIFPQAHLSSIVDNKVIGQNWNAAFRHINGKSVDFVLCDKSYIAPRLAIELDDRTHQRMDRLARDGEVERILNQAGLPLLRLDNRGNFNPTEISQQIKAYLAK